MISYETLKSFTQKDNLPPSLQYVVKRKDGWWATDSYRIICVPIEQVQDDMRFFSNEIPKKMIYPNVERVLDVEGFTPKHTFKTTILEDALKRLPLVDEYKEEERALEFINCPECYDGSIEISDTIFYNKFAIEVSAECECPICHGYGKIPNIEDYNPNIDEYDPYSDKTYKVSVKTGRKIPNIQEGVFYIKDIAYIKASYIQDLVDIAKEHGVDEIEFGGGDYVHVLIFRLLGVVVGFMPYYVEKIHDSCVEIDIVNKLET